MSARPTRMPIRVKGLLGYLLAWSVIGLWLVPLLIAQAYREDSLPVLNGILAGRTVHPLEFYLEAWWGVFVRATLVFLVAGAAWVFPRAREKLISRVVSGGSELRSHRLLLYALWLGTLGGLGEAVYRAVRLAVTHRMIEGFYRELFWMAPLSSATALLLVGLFMVAFAAAGNTRWSVGKATFLLAFLAVYPVLQSPGIRLHSASEVLLTLGMASVVARLADNHSTVLVRWIGAAKPYFAALALGLLLFAWRILPSGVERRSVLGRPEADAGQPNILLIILDTVRSDHLSTYGYSRPTTPRLDEWAESGLIFDRAVATAPWTLPTHATVLTGRYNLDLLTGGSRPFDGTYPTLSEILADHGYATAGFVANPYYTTDVSGLQRGFDRWEDWTLDMSRVFSSSWLSDVLLRTLDRHVNRRLYPARKNASRVADEFLTWQGALEDRPFFALLNFIDAHDPYTLPGSLPDTFGPLPPEPWSEFSAEWQSDESVQYTPLRTRLWVNRYDNALRYIDHNLGIIRDSLEARGLLESTIVVVTADHGEMWGEHGQIGHANSLYLPLLHVPLILSFPPKVPTGQRVGSEVSLRDLPATILDLASLDPAELSGYSLAPLWEPESNEGLRSAAFAEMDYSGSDRNPWDPVSRGDMKTLVRGDFHYILNGDGVEELYDLSVDTSELRDLASDPAYHGVKVRIRLALDSIIDRRDRAP